MQWDIGFLSVGFSPFRSSFKTDNRYCVVSTTDLINNSQSAETAKASNMAPKKRGSRSNGGGDLAASTMGGEGKSQVEDPLSNGDKSVEAPAVTPHKGKKKTRGPKRKIDEHVEGDSEEVMRLKSVSRLRLAKIASMESELSAHAQSTRKDAQRWARRSIAKFDLLGQTMVNTFSVGFFMHEPFLPDDFDVFSKDKDTICGIILKMIGKERRVPPGGLSDEMYYRNWICGALSYKMGALRNRRLSSLGTVVKGTFV